MSAIWHRLIDVTCPHGGAVVAIAEIYFDETGTHDGSRVMGVAGYIFLKSKAQKFSKVWRRHLRTKGLPYFHMKDCAHGNGPYAGWEPEDRVEHEKRLIALVKETSLLGFAVCCKVQDFKDYAGSVLNSRYSAYTYLLMNAVGMACGHLKEMEFKGRASFIFEAGHEYQSQAGELMGRITSSFPEEYYSPNYAFVHKTDAPPLQAADLLAWLARNTLMKTLDAKPVRRDFVALASDGHRICYADEEAIARFAEIYAGRKPDLRQPSPPMIVRLPE